MRAYQEVDPLKIGELWAIAITLRITLVENLRRLIEIVIARLNDADKADNVAQKILANVPDAETNAANATRANHDISDFYRTA